MDISTIHIFTFLQIIFTFINSIRLRFLFKKDSKLERIFRLNILFRLSKGKLYLLACAKL